MTQDVLDNHTCIVIGRLLHKDADEIRQMVEHWEAIEGSLPAFPWDYQKASNATGRPKGTLSSRVARGFYIEGVDFVRKSPRKVLFSRVILQREHER